jgi:hypothetical protein
MTPNPRELERVQRWMQTVIKHPDGIEAGLSDDEARAQIDVDASNVSRVICRSKALSEIERLAIYANAYYARLLECLREEYPALQRALGEELFDGFAFGYLQACPSHSYTLANLGADFADYLRQTRPGREEGTTGPDWADLMIDLARLERAFAEIFDGPGTEGERCLDQTDLLAIPPERWPDAQLIAAPCLRLMTFDFPVHDYASAVRRGETPTLPSEAKTFLALTRRDFVVRRQSLSAVSYRILERLVAGDSLAAAISVGAGEAEIADDEFGPLLRKWFEEWTAARYFVRVTLPNGS